MTTHIEPDGSAVPLQSSGVVLEDIDTLKDAARFLRVAPNTLRNWYHMGKIPGIELDRAVMFTRDDITAYIDKYHRYHVVRHRDSTFREQQQPLAINRRVANYGPRKPRNAAD